jgi:hypothetical protein
MLCTWDAVASASTAVNLAEQGCNLLAACGSSLPWLAARVSSRRPQRLRCVRINE